MKKLISSLLIPVLLLSCCQAREINKNSQPGTVNIQGRILNNSAEFVEMAASGYFNSHSQSIPVKSDGTFNMSIPIEGLQDIYIYFDKLVLTLFAQQGDTIQLYWDANRFENTLQVTSPNHNLARDLQTCLELAWKFRKPYLNLSNKLYNERTTADSTRFNWINKLYNDELNFVMADTNHLSPSIQKIVNDTYYKYANLLLSHRLGNNFQLKTDYPASGLSVLKKVDPIIKGVFPNAKTINKEIFWISHTYRSYIYTYITSKARSISSNFTHILYLDTTYKPHYTFMWNEYYTIMANTPSYPVRDWIVTSSIMFGFTHYPFDEVSAVLQDFLPKCTVQAYHDTLLTLYNHVKRLQRGNNAPDFTLRNEKGQPVSLHDFKGKVVYIDFWGLACGPCIRDIKKFVPALHQRYKDKEVVFLNICLCSGRTEPGWQAKLNEYQLSGVNVLAPGWPANDICKSYNIISIPHYVLIDQEGRIALSNAPGPEELLRPAQNEIDKLLAK